MKTRRYIGAKRDGVREITDPAAAQDAFVGLFGGKKPEAEPVQ